MAAIVIKNAQDAEFRLEHRDGDESITIAGRDLRAYATPGYDIDTASWIPSTLTGGAIIERGSNANGNYRKFADGTMICFFSKALSGLSGADNAGTWTYPVSFVENPYPSVTATLSGYASNRINIGGSVNLTHFGIGTMFVDNTNYTLDGNTWANFIAIGRWK